MHMFTITELHSSFVERIAWVNPTSGDHHIYSGPDPVISSEPFELIQLLVGIYREMTKHDAPKPVLTPYMFPSQLRATSEPHFTRETFAMLVSRVMSRIHLPGGDWAAVIRSIRNMLGMMDHDSGLITHIRDLEVQFRLHGLPVEPMVSDEYFRRRAETASVFRGWANVPRLVCVTLVVPSEKLDRIRGDRAEPWPRLVCELGVDGDDRYVTYSSIQTVWGELVPSPESTEKYLIQEDPERFRSSSDLVVSFWADADIVASQPYVSLCLRKTQPVIVKYGALGPRLQLFAAKVGGERVHITRERPMAEQTQPTFRYVSNSVVNDDGTKCQLVVTTGKGVESVGSLRVRVQVDKASINGRTPVITQLGPCTLELAFGDEKRVVKFPYPVRHSDCGLRMKRNARQIDVLAPIPEPIQMGGYPSSPFPIIHHIYPSPWNIHHLYIDRMPKVDIQQKSKIRKWLIEHTTIQMSDRERMVQQNTQPANRRPSEVLVDVKEMITLLVQDYAGIQNSSEGSVSAFAFMEPTHGLYLVILIGGLRLDLAGATLVLDCAIVPVSPKAIQDLPPTAISQLESQTQVRKFQKTPAEIIAWKHLIPAFVERIRTWSHRHDCEYKASGKIPLNEDVESDPLCKCGRGIGFSGPEWQTPIWKELLPNATRAAISPLFGVPTLERVVGSASRTQKINSKSAVTELEPVNSCWGCGGAGRPLLMCTKCKRARYCSKDCQIVHWKAHKRECKAP
ncbi:unnamed protein product [Rhizoctonia solani]|uniref:MYND-type domain-containing protein n=1 Tax=Rhizoctonia solani TaxID=456999 RepID=A0A8H3AB70_9AGAM|nr:unnamed protein product [Rhizoctonia solani]